MPHVVVLVVVVVVVLVVVMVAEVTGAPSASPARADVDEFLCASSISWAVAIGREGKKSLSLILRWWMLLFTVLELRCRHGHW